MRQQLLVAVTEREGLKEQGKALQQLLLQKEVGGAGGKRAGLQLVRCGWGWWEEAGLQLVRCGWGWWEAGETTLIL